MKKTPSVKFAVIFVLFLVPQLLFGGLMEYPRRVNVIKTQYFDVLFPDECANTAKIVADNADFFYDKAFILVQGSYKFRCPIVISPDSSRLSVTYAATPYNRIVIYDSISDMENIAYNDILLDLLNHEIFRAVSQSKKTAFWHYMSVIFGADALQPVSLINMPFSFAEGLTYAAEGNEKNGIINDQFYMQILVQAKIENKFPDWIQCTGARDIYPDDHLAMAAGSAFSAYIQQRWGFDKYLEYWNECGKIYLFSLYPGDFKKVYGVSLSKAWEDFKESIQIPQNLSQRDDSLSAIYDDGDSLYSFLVHSPYGFVWYDKIKHEVSLFDPDSEWKFNRLLFLASDINNLTLSPDGRFLIISLYEEQSRDNFHKDSVYFYDLKNRRNISGEYELRDANLVILEDGTYAVAGISVMEKHPVFKVIQCGQLNTYVSKEKNPDNYKKYDDSEIYRKDYDFSAIPFAPSYAGKGKLVYPVCRNNSWYLVTLNIAANKDKVYVLEDSSLKSIKFRNLRFMYETTDNQVLYSFEYINEGDSSLTRSGFIVADENPDIKRLLLQSDDFSGGIHCPVVIGNELYYTSEFLLHNDIRHIPLESINTEEGNFTAVLNEELPLYNEEAVSKVEYGKGWWIFKKRTLADYDLGTYNPFYYMFHGTFIPMLPVKEINLDTGTQLFPGLGLTYFTQSDPFFNNDVTLSACAGFAKLDFTKLINEDERSLKEFSKGLVDFSRVFSFSGYIQNTSTPVDIILGGLFNFNIEGSYKFDGILGGAYNLPLGMTIHNLNFKAQFKTTVSTSYMDELQVDTHPELPGWIDISQAYRDVMLSTSAKYSCIHQFGISSYEKRGVEIGSTLFAVWDLNYIEAKKQEEELKAKLAETESSSADSTSASTGDVNTVVNKNYVSSSSDSSSSSNIFDYASQIYLGLYGKIEIPYLTPIKNCNNWILSVPGTIYAELMNTSGTAFLAKGDFLLFGKEIQQGVPALLLYFSRVGLRAGYEVAWIYDSEDMVPDLRQMSTFYDIFSETTFRDRIYAILNLEMVPVIGKLSTALAQGNFTFSYYPRTSTFKFTVDFNFNF